MTPFVPSSGSAASDAATELTLNLLGPSAAMAQLWTQLRRLAPHVRTLLLTGAPHCGQRSVARLLFELSPLHHRSFLELSAEKAEDHLLRSSAVNAIPAEGLLFLQEVDLLSPAAQQALLRLLKQRRSRAFCVAAAATADLRTMAAQHRFLAPLAEVLSAVQVTLPELHRRAEDLPLLIPHLLVAASRDARVAVPQVTESFLRAAMEYHWPGNLRELQEVLARVAASGAAELRAEHLTRAREVIAVQQPASAAPIACLMPLHTAIQQHVSAVLGACRGNKQRAAEVLGISRSTLYRMLDEAAVHTQTPAFAMAS